MLNNIDFLADDEESHPLSLPYFKCHRVVLESFHKHDFSAMAIKVYLYLSHNCLIHHGRSFQVSVEEVAAYFGKSTRTIYRAFEEIEDSKLASIREHGRIVFSMPAIVVAQIEAKQLAVSSKYQAIEDAFEAQIQSALLDMEATLKRKLTMRETEDFTRRMMQRLLTERNEGD